MVPVVPVRMPDVGAGVEHRREQEGAVLHPRVPNPGSVDDVMQRFGLVDRVSVDQHIRMHVRLAGIP